MAYVSYEEYRDYADAAIDEAEYNRLAPLVDLIIDHWTLERVGRAYRAGETLPDHVVSLYCAIVYHLPSVIEASGERVSSFSNGVDSFSFDVPETVEAELGKSLGWMISMLPVEWSSACVPFDGGNRYAG